MIKSFAAQLTTVIRHPRGRRNLGALWRFFVVLAGMITVYSVIFHLLMQREGQDHSWTTGFYWTLTVMSTLGFGDITFHSDLGRAFSILVLLSGMIFLLILLPFTFIEFFYEPWMAAQEAQRAPRHIAGATKGHVLIANPGAITSALVRRLDQYKVDYSLVVPKLDEALRLHDEGWSVLVGELDDPDTWRRAGAERASLIASTSTDVTNTHVAFTAREVAESVPIVTSARDAASVDILHLAGASYVLRLEEMIGQSFARRTLGGDAMTHVIGEFDELLIAEATAHRTPLVGKSLKENQLREKVGITVLGVWERGHFEAARPETMIDENTVLVLAGTKDTLFRYDELFCIYNVSAAPVVILGGGKVGTATARALEQREVDYRIVEIDPELIGDPEKYVHGNAANLDVLEKAGIREASTVIITPNDDDLNVYLTIYCRRLRPDVQILCRATEERNVATLHRAGADSVLSYASMGASAIMNVRQRQKIVMVAEGLDIFEVKLPEELAGKTILDCGVREQTGCSVVAIRTAGGIEVSPDPGTVLESGSEIVLIGTVEAEDRFLERFGVGMGRGSA